MIWTCMLTILLRPGAPNGATRDSYGSMMEVEYVAVYQN